MARVGLARGSKACRSRANALHRPAPLGFVIIGSCPPFLPFLSSPLPSSLSLSHFLIGPLHARMAAAAQPSMLVGMLRHFPAVKHAFAYGSGVLHQPGLYGQESAGASGSGSAAALPSSSKGPMLDFIFAVEDPKAWHEQVSVSKEKAHGRAISMRRRLPH
jgi:hypothetical protein